MLSSAPLKAQSPQIVECLKTIDLFDADMELDRLLSRKVARLGDLDGDPHAQRSLQSSACFECARRGH